LYAKSTLSLASNANTCASLFAERNFALFPIPVPASSIVVFEFKNLLKFSIVFQPYLSKNHFL